jgi:lipoprotein LprG
VLAALLTSCSGVASSTKPNQPPQIRLAAAKKSFDRAAYIGFTLTADSLPSGLQGLLSASGTGTHAPAFTGTVKVQSAVDFSAPLIAVNGHVYAKLPFAGWSQLNPGDYGAPDPARLMDRTSGISSLLTATRNAHEGSSTREQDHVYTSILGTIPSSAIRRVFPSAGAKDFTADFSLDDNNSLAGGTITGPFYAGYADVTYTLQVNLGADAVDITAPN